MSTQLLIDIYNDEVAAGARVVRAFPGGVRALYNPLRILLHGILAKREDVHTDEFFGFKRLAPFDKTSRLSLVLETDHPIPGASSLMLRPLPYDLPKDEELLHFIDVGVLRVVTDAAIFDDFYAAVEALAVPAEMRVVRKTFGDWTAEYLVGVETMPLTLKGPDLKFLNISFLV